MKLSTITWAIIFFLFTCIVSTDATADRKCRKLRWKGKGNLEMHDCHKASKKKGKHKYKDDDDDDDKRECKSGDGDCDSADDSGLKLCLGQGGYLVIRGSCGSGEIRLDAEQLTLLADTSFTGVPSGKTITGVLSAMYYSSAASDWSISASLPAKLDKNLTSADVIIATTEGLVSACGSAADCLSAEELSAGSVCTGTAANPTAPPGKVCIYPLADINAADLVGVPVPTQGGKYGFAVNWRTAHVGQTQFGAVWAFKAP